MDKELIDALNVSIEMEEEGRRFYLLTAKKAIDEISKKIFEALADDETRHMAAIKGYCEKIARKNEAPQLCSVMARHKDIRKRIIFGKSREELLRNIAPRTEGLKAYEIGMQMENRGYKFYKETMESVKDPNVKGLYKFLIKEEEAHYELLSSTYEYLRDPASWFAKEEKPIVEG